MALEYSVEVIKELEKVFKATGLHRPMRVERYEPGTELIYDVTGISQPNKGRIRLVVEKFVGGGFAGQVYRIKILDIDPPTGSNDELEKGKVYAMKILVPPSGFSRLFRNILYWVGFQAPFQLQVNPAAARAGAIWQKFIRRGAGIRFGDERSVVNIHAIFVDSRLGSCGELSEWVDGRTWRLEVDERMDLLRRWIKGKKVDLEGLGSPEYREKWEFMHGFVELLHDMGGHEFARQYEWSTCKSQPNCLKRNGTDQSLSKGLTAVDFRAGLALLPFLPMSPGDFKLIGQGLTRGSLVQFDRGDLAKLDQFTNNHSDVFRDMSEMREDLKIAENVYRNSVPDITHNHFRLLCSKRLWSTILGSTITGWKVRNHIDERSEKKLRNNKPLGLFFFLLGFLPFLGLFVRKIWGQPNWRRHYWKMLTSWNYLRRAVKGKMIERVITWHRSGRIEGPRTFLITTELWRSLYHLPLSLLPGGLHRFVTDWQYAKEKLYYLAIRPVRLYLNASLREQWLTDMVAEGKAKQLLTHEDAEIILSQIKEPFIQKYLKSLAVHICTLPVTQVVSLIVALIFWMMNPEMSSAARGLAVAGILVAFQVTPISPGSFVRGSYVLYLVIRERNFKDYNIALFLGFFKYIGYLAFPIQMGYRYPALARFMAAHWATEAVHAIPVFGERGALLERSVFCLFYNWPLTLRRRMRKRSQIRGQMNPRYWHIVLCVIAGLVVLGVADFVYLKNSGALPSLKEIWPLVGLVSILGGSVVTLGARGAPLSRRLIGAVVCGSVIGGLYTVLSTAIGYSGTVEISKIATLCLWRVFIFAILSFFGAILTELNLPEPTMR